MTVLRTDDPYQHEEGNKSWCQEGEKGLQGESPDHRLSVLVLWRDDENRKTYTASMLM